MHCLFFLFIEVIKDIKNKNFIFVSTCALIFSFLVAHSFIADNLLNLKFYFSIFFLLYLFGIAYYFHGIILENKEKIIFLFISLFLFSFLFVFQDTTSNPEPVSCGAIKNFFGGSTNDVGTPIFFIHFLSSYNLIFDENSHLAMSGIAVIIYSIFLITKEKKNKYLIIFLFLFLLICFLKSSATLLAGTIFSITALVVFEYKRLNRYFIIFSLILVSSLAIIFSQDKVCVNKISLSQTDYKEIQQINPFIQKQTIKDINEIENKILLAQKELREAAERLAAEKEKNKISIEKKKTKKKKVVSPEKEAAEREAAEREAAEREAAERKAAEREAAERERIAKIAQQNEIKKLEKKLLALQARQKIITLQINEEFKEYDSVYQSSLSSEVFFHALKVTFDSFFIKPYGWGFQGYELAFNAYNKKNKVYKKSLNVFNNKDASNTFFKIVTEFGFFALFLYLILLFILCSRKVSIENKIFLIPFIVTQSIRGAGYFNAAYALVLLLLIVIQFKKLKKQNN